MSNRSDPLGAALADRHYSRQKPGTPQFVGNGSSVVLLAPVEGEPRALWVTKWQKYVRTPWWKDAWVCSLFRNEGAGLASELVMEAVAATRAVWGEPPARGFVTFVNGGMVRHKRDPGRCFRKAGWQVVGRSSEGLIVFQLAPENFPAAVEPHEYQRPLIYPARDWSNRLSRHLRPEAA